MADSPGDVTVLLARMKSGNAEALTELLPLVYQELRRLAAHYMRHESGNTLQPTALVHEAYLRLTRQNRANWQNRAQFMGVAGQLMRRILVDHARERCAAKRGGGALTTLEESVAQRLADAAKPEEILAVHQVLERLERMDSEQGRLVELRYFAGLSAEETAEAMGLPLRTVEREWTTAKAWLRAQLAGESA
jgi:RNA polymerase sigma factor (TIGR02999 family)